MSKLSPAVASAFWLLRYDIFRHLDEAEFLGLKNAEWTDEDADSARLLIADLVEVIRGTVVLHDNQRDADCRGCGQPWPCGTFETLHALVKRPDTEIVRLLSQKVA
jgi:hypothetical protein